MGYPHDYGNLQMSWHCNICGNLAPVDRWSNLLFIGFQPSKVVQDFATIHSMWRQQLSHGICSVREGWPNNWEQYGNMISQLLLYIYIYPYNYRISSTYSTWDYTGNIYNYMYTTVCIYIGWYWLYFDRISGWIILTSLCMYGESSPNGHMITAEIAANSEIIRPDTYGTISYMALSHLVPFY